MGLGVCLYESNLAGNSGVPYSTEDLIPTRILYDPLKVEALAIRAKGGIARRTEMKSMELFPFFRAKAEHQKVLETYRSTSLPLECNFGIRVSISGVRASLDMYEKIFTFHDFRFRKKAAATFLPPPCKTKPMGTEELLRGFRANGLGDSRAARMGIQPSGPIGSQLWC